MRDHPGKLTTFELRHFFAPGLYGREIFIPAGQLMVGKVHLRDHLCIVLGDLSIYSTDGLKRFEGYHHFTTKAGAQRTAYAHTDAWFTTIHANPGDERDIAKIEARNVSDDFSLIDHFPDELKLIGATV
jgi:hypothetical protein